MVVSPVGRPFPYVQATAAVHLRPLTTMQQQVENGLWHHDNPDLNQATAGANQHHCHAQCRPAMHRQHSEGAPQRCRRRPGVGAHHGAEGAGQQPKH